MEEVGEEEGKSEEEGMVGRNGPCTALASPVGPASTQLVAVGRWQEDSPF